MPATPLFADLHCHPSFKPYGQSFTPGNARPAPVPADVVSLWHESEITGIDAWLSEKLGVAMYTQGDFFAAALGGVQVICFSLGGLEQEFITISRPLPKAVIDILKVATGGKVDAQNFLLNLVTRFGITRLNKVRSSAAYFPDLIAEAVFVRAQAGIVFRLSDGRFYTFRIAASGVEVRDTILRNAAPGAGSTATQPVTISIVLSMEGLHNLDAGHGADEATVLRHVQELKTGAAGRMAFVTFCHHFWNGLCGHAKSLPVMMSAVFDQEAHMGEGFNALGLKVAMALLDATADRRILIDMKHMSYRARKQYFNLLAGSIPKDIPQDAALDKALRAFFRFNASAAPGTAASVPPPIMSHAAVSGYADESDKTYHGAYPAQTPDGVMNPFENSEMYPDPSINFYDADLINMARFSGLIGIQLDAHRIAGPTGLRVAAERAHPYAWLVWNQVLHMVELWDAIGYGGAWDRICIGSDFDGIICPLDGLHRSSDYPALREGLLYYAGLYFMTAADFAREKPGMERRGIIANRWQVYARNPAGTRLSAKGLNAPEQTGLNAAKVVDKICGGNVAAFLERHFV